MRGYLSEEVEVNYVTYVRCIFSDKQDTGIQQEFYRNSTGIQIEFLNIGRKICLCYSRHLIFTGIQNYRNSVYRNSPEFTGIHKFLFVR